MRPGETEQQFLSRKIDSLDEAARAARKRTLEKEREGERERALVTPPGDSVCYDREREEKRACESFISFQI